MASFEEVYNLMEEERKENPIHCDTILTNTDEAKKNFILVNLNANILNIDHDDTGIHIRGLGYDMVIYNKKKVPNGKDRLTLITDDTRNSQFNRYLELSETETNFALGELTRFLIIKRNSKKFERAETTEIPIDFIKDLAKAECKGKY